MLSSEEAREKYPSGGTKEPSGEPKAANESGSNRSSRGGANFSRYGMVNQPPTRKPSKRDY